MGLAAWSKRTARRESMLSRLTHSVPLVIAIWLFAAARILRGRFLPDGAGWWWLGAVLVAAGLAWTVYARAVLGRNWSAEVTFKQDHELIESGPYALVRHPIYTGLVVMALGTAINYGRVIGFVLFIGLCGALWWKARQEERIMASHFPGAYADYKARVHAIVPFVL